MYIFLSISSVLVTYKKSSQRPNFYIYMYKYICVHMQDQLNLVRNALSVMIVGVAIV